MRRGGTVPPSSEGRGGTHMAITNKIVNEGLRPTLPSSLFAVGWLICWHFLFLCCCRFTGVAKWLFEDPLAVVDRQSLDFLLHPRTLLLQANLPRMWSPPLRACPPTYGRLLACWFSSCSSNAVAAAMLPHRGDSKERLLNGLMNHTNMVNM